MVAVAFAVRLIVMALFYHVSFDARFDHWYFGYEEGRVARSIATGRGFGNPLWGLSGPTSWYAPIYPYILAADFKIFGVFTLAACFAILTFNALTSALTCLPLFFFARRTLGEGAGLAAGWAWVFYPYAFYWPIIRIWDTWLATLLLAILFCVILRLERSPKLWHWIGFGLLSGVAALTDPSVLSVLPVLALWAVWRLHQQRKRWLVPAISAVAAVIIAVSPWVIRDEAVFHRLIPIRDNIALEFRVGNSGNTVQTMDLYAGPWLPWVNHNEWPAYQRMGEIAYFHWKGQQAAAYIKAHPFWYVYMTGRRALFVWSGFWSFSRAYRIGQTLDPLAISFLSLLSVLTFMGLRRAFRNRGADAALPYALALIFFPLVYYLTHVERWYRCPMDPFLIALASYEVHFRVAQWLRRRREMPPATGAPRRLPSREAHERVIAADR